jgi:hypothetical protein
LRGETVSLGPLKEELNMTLTPFIAVPDLRLLPAAPAIYGGGANPALLSVIN